MDKVFKRVELVGTSEKSFEDAVCTAIDRASKTIHGLAWFEVSEQHGKITDGKVVEYQVILKVAFKLD
ncbi:MAG: dodecin [Thermodesulfobacteriota bacterium]